jgi:hypothetical protein
MTVKELTEIIHAAGPDREVKIACGDRLFPVVIGNLPYVGPVVLRPDEPIMNEGR